MILAFTLTYANSTCRSVQSNSDLFTTTVNINIYIAANVEMISGKKLSGISAAAHMVKKDAPLSISMDRHTCSRQ